MGVEAHISNRDYRADDLGLSSPTKVAGATPEETTSGDEQAGRGLAWGWPAPTACVSAETLILDSVAKRSEAENGLKLERDCPSGFITGHCENGHRFAKEVYCGLEWCPVCNGRWVKGDMKPAHGRRFARWYPKAQQIAGMGYWTFTIPPALRRGFRTKTALGRLGHDIQELLKSYGYSRGLRRWHFFGDKSQSYHPHLNCLVDGRHIGKKELRAIRRAYSRLLGVKLAVAEYHYLTTPGEKVHALKYVTRATFLDWRWDVELAGELHGFRNQLWWGSGLWDGWPVWSLNELPAKVKGELSEEVVKAVASLENGECPHDGKPIDWERFQPIKRLPGLMGVHLAAGYWLLPPARPPPYRIDLSDYDRRCFWHEVLTEALGANGLLPQSYGHVSGTSGLSVHHDIAQQVLKVDILTDSGGGGEKWIGI